MKADDYEFTVDEIRTIEIHRDKQKNSRMKLRLVALLPLQKNNVKYVASIIGFVPHTIENWFRKS